jgi:hypothetical protein
MFSPCPAPQCVQSDVHSDFISGLVQRCRRVRKSAKTSQRIANGGAKDTSGGGRGKPRLRTFSSEFTLSHSVPFTAWRCFFPFWVFSVPSTCSLWTHVVGAQVPLRAVGSRRRARGHKKRERERKKRGRGVGKRHQPSPRDTLAARVLAFYMVRHPRR